MRLRKQLWKEKCILPVTVLTFVLYSIKPQDQEHTNKIKSELCILQTMFIVRITFIGIKNNMKREREEKHDGMLTCIIVHLN